MEIVTVQFQERSMLGVFTEREFHYKTMVPLEEGMVIRVPTRYGTGTARVKRIGVKDSLFREDELRIIDASCLQITVDQMEAGKEELKQEGTAI